MKYLFILNPISGNKLKGQQLLDLIDSRFRNSRHQYEFAYTTGAGDAAKLAHDAANNHFDVVVAAGGDGTVNEIGSALIHTDTAIGIIPLGSGNGIARSYGIPLKTIDAIDFNLEGSISAVDTGKVNDQYFIGTCGIGLDADVSSQFQEFGTRGPLPYFLIGLKEMSRFSPQHVSVTFDDQKIETDPLVVVVANTEQYGNGATISPNADPRDGLFDLCIIENMPFSRKCQATYHLFHRSLDELPEYRRFKTAELEMAFSAAGAFHTDGEPFRREQSLHLQNIKQSLKIIAAR